MSTQHMLAAIPLPSLAMSLSILHICLLLIDYYTVISSARPAVGLFPSLK